jgi:hypothetical protein
MSIFILQGSGVLQYHPGRACCSSNHWVLIGSNDLHRFWDVCYVGHADDIKKHLWLQHIVTSNVFHGYVILIAHDRRGDASQDPVGVSTGCAHSIPQNANLRILTVVWNSWLTPYLDLWSIVRFPHRLHDLWSYLSPHRKSSILGVCQKCANSRVLGGSQKRPKMTILGGPKKTPNLGGQFVKNPFRGTQLYGDTRQIIYCLDTRYGTPKHCFWVQNVFYPSRPGVVKMHVLVHLANVTF